MSLTSAASATTRTVITESLTVTELPARVVELCSSDAAGWTAGDLAYYITIELALIHGPQLPCRGQAEILHQFFERHGENAVHIARFAFENMHGMWMGAPVTVRRFAEGHDDFFARPVMEMAG